MSTFTKGTSGKIIYEDIDGKRGFSSSLNVLPHPSDNEAIVLTPFASAQQFNDEAFVFTWSKVTLPAGAADRDALIDTLTNDFFLPIDKNDVQYPLPVDGDSVHAKDIDGSTSILSDFSGLVTDLFDDLHSENVDNTSNNPKLLTIHFKRTVVTPLVGIGSSEGGNFSNVKIIGILSGNIETTLVDNSADNTNRTTQFFQFPNAGLNALRLEFYTVDSVSITNVFIPKIRPVSAIMETAVKYATSYKSPYLLNAASQDMNVNGSITPVDFSTTITGITSAKWIRSFIDLQDGAQNFDPADFGSISALTNGVDIIVEKDGAEYIMENWKTNMDISMTMYNFDSPFKVGAYIGRWTIPSDIGSPITLFPDDKIILRVNDDLTSLDAFRFRVKLSQ